MISKSVVTLAALSLVAGSSAAAAQSAAPLSLANSPQVQRASAETHGDSQFLRRSGWLLGIVALGILVFVILESSKDNALPNSA
jgi:hypothetical protein